MVPNKRLNLALVGCGQQGHRLLQSLKSIPEKLRPRMAAICDPWPLSRKSALRICIDPRVEECSDIGQLLERSTGKIDALLIASPDYLHEGQALAALHHGCHVYLEPPMALTAAGARELNRVAREKGLLLQIGYHRRSHPNYRFAMAEEYREPIYKKINIITTYYSVPRPQPALADIEPGLAVPPEILDGLGFDTMQDFLHWRSSSRCSAGYLCNEVGHQINAAIWALGDARAVFASGMRVGLESAGLDCVDSVIEFAMPDGSVARMVNHLQIGHRLPGVFEAFHGIDGTVTLDERRQLAMLCRESHAPRQELDSDRPLGSNFFRRRGMEGTTREDESTLLRSTSRMFACVRGGTSPVDGSFYFKAPFSNPLWRAHLENFFSAIESQRRGDEPVLNCPGSEGYATTALCLKVREAAISHDPIDLDQAG